MAEVDLVPVVRPDGRVYKPRKLPRAQVVQNVDDREPYAWVLVLGTHDVDRAHALAARVAAGEGMYADRATAERTWMRLAMRNGDPVYDRDPVRGAATVTFVVTDDPPALSVEGKDTNHDH